jgi:DNA-binding GntR family transcriptional regulator
LASEFGVSHVPLREAIQRLEAEGFLALHPRRGAFVMPLSADDAREIFDLRVTLETKALRASIPGLTSEQLQIVRENCAAADGVTDLVQYSELNVQSHRALFAGANRPRLQSLIQTLWSNCARYAMLLGSKGGHFQQSHIDHWDLVGAAVNRDTERACATLTVHIAAAARKILSIIAEDRVGPQSAQRTASSQALLTGRGEPMPRRRRMHAADRHRRARR